MLRGSHPSGNAPASPFPGALAAFVILVLSLLLPVTSAGAKPKDPASGTGIVWPPPPLPARIALIQSISSPSDAGVKVSTLGRMANWLTGAGKGNERLVRPFGIACDEDNNLCITDTAEKSVAYLDRRQKKWFRFQKAGKLEFNSPVSVAKSGSTLFVADSAAGHVVAMSDQGKLLFLITNELARPAALALLKDKLLVVDSQQHRVCSYSLSGNFLGAYGGRGAEPGKFNFPTHIATDLSGNVYVTDSMNGRIQIFDASGTFKSQIGSLGDTPGHFGRPKGVAVDGLGHIYVIDGLFDNLQIFNIQGQLLLTVGENGTGPGQFWLPNGIAINKANEIYISDSYNRRLQVLKYIGPQ